MCYTWEGGVGSAALTRKAEKVPRAQSQNLSKTPEIRAHTAT